jgi:hypothetical protein
MNGEKTTWRFSKDLLALTIKKGTNKATPFFFEYEDKNRAKKRRENLIAEKKAEEKRKEEERLAEEKRIAEEKQIAEEKRLAEEKRKEEERIAEEKRIAEERLAEEKKIAEEKRIAEEKKAEEQKLQGLFEKYNAQSQFQKDFVKLMLKSGAKFEDLRFSRNDKFIEIINISIGNADNYTLIEKIEIKNLNKKVFDNLELAIRLNEFDFEVFKNKKWFEEINFTKINTSSDIIVFSVDKYVLKNLEFKNFENNKQLINNDTLNEDHINLISAGLSFSLGKFYGENLHLEIDGAREIITQYFDITNFSLLEWGRWNTKNSSDYDYNTDTKFLQTISYF